jgi:Tol biopolymer transport system component
MKSVTIAGRCARGVIACGLVLAAAGCGDSTPVGIAGPTTGVLQVTVSTSGADLPASGYTVSVDSGAGQPAPVNGKLSVAGLDAGSHSVTMYGAPHNCALSGASTRAVDVVAGDTALVAFYVGCTATNHIAFVSSRDGNWHIYVTNADGVTRLTSNPGVDANPAWSPDGARIAFASNRDGNFEIYVMDADGLHPTRLTNTTTDDYDPAWSPDGKKIAFTSERDGGPGVYVMEADGSSPVRLTEGANDPTWSPDGTRIAFVSHRDGNGQIYVMNADGSHVTRVTGDPTEDCEPAWSPDGRRIAFVSGCTATLFPDGYGSSIYLMNADGSNPVLLTGGPADVPQARFPSWSSDGTEIAFASPAACRNSDADGCHWWWPYGVYVVKVDGSSVASLVPYDDNSNALDPSWRR